MPVTFLTFSMGYLAIIGFPGFSGFWSKDRIIEVALDQNILVGVLAMIGAGITGFYMTRLMLMTFFTEKRWAEDVHPHESPKVMTIPLIVLAALSVFGGVMLIGNWIVDFLEPVTGTPVPESPPIPSWAVSVIVVLIVAVGVAIAWFVVGKQRVPREAPQEVSWPVRAARAELYGNEVNDELVVKPGAHLVHGLTMVDHYGVDGVVEGGALAVGGVGTALRRTQTGLRALLRPVTRGRRHPRRRGPPGGEPDMNHPTTFFSSPASLRRRTTPQGPRNERLPVPDRHDRAAAGRRDRDGCPSAGPRQGTAQAGRARRLDPDARPRGGDGVRLQPRRRLPVHRGRHLDQGVRRPLRRRRRRARPADGAADRRAGPGRDRGQLVRRRRGAHEGVLRLGAGARGSRVGGLRGHRRLLLLRRVRGDPDPGVLPDRRLRRPGSSPRRGEVPDLPARRRSGDAGRR